MHARPHARTRNARACARTAPHTSSDSELACACCHRQVGAHASPRGPSTRAAPSPGAQARGRRHPDGGAPAPQGQALHKDVEGVSVARVCVCQWYHAHVRAQQARRKGYRAQRAAGEKACTPPSPAKHNAAASHRRRRGIAAWYIEGTILKTIGALLGGPQA